VPETQGNPPPGLQGEASQQVGLSCFWTASRLSQALSGADTSGTTNATSLERGGRRQDIERQIPAEDPRKIQDQTSAQVRLLATSWTAKLEALIVSEVAKKVREEVTNAVAQVQLEQRASLLQEGASHSGLAKQHAEEVNTLPPSLNLSSNDEKARVLQSFVEKCKEVNDDHPQAPLKDRLCKVLPEFKAARCYCKSMECYEAGITPYFKDETLSFHSFQRQMAWLEKKLQGML
jgi:hypothetical protein